MKLYTIQSYDKWLEFQDKRILIANKEYIDNYFIRPYDWLVGKMNKLIANELNIEYPIWCWGEKDKPDLRRSCHGKRGDKAVLIIFESAPADVLFTDFGWWHQVLNFGPIPATVEESDKYCNDEIEYTHEEIVKSWDNLFNIPEELKYDNTLQGTLWYVKMEQVKKYKIFICK